MSILKKLLPPPTKGLIGFTLAEVLITLTIIGIVAAITLPSLLVNVNDKSWNAQRKALHARISQAIGEMDTIAGIGASNGESPQDVKETASEMFIINGLSKVYRVQNTCGKNNMNACGIPSKIIKMNGEEENFPKELSDFDRIMFNDPSYDNELTTASNFDGAAFETVNGESIALYYNPFCGSPSVSYAYDSIQKKMCVNMIYDLNGLKGPNEMGKDIGFITVFYSSDPVVVAPIPLSSDLSTSAALVPDEDGEKSASILCKESDEDSRLPTKEELGAMCINDEALIGNFNGSTYWSSTIITAGDEGKAISMSFNGSGDIYKETKSYHNSIRCVKK